MTFEENESVRRYAKKLLDQCDGNVSELARRLGLVSSGVGRFLFGEQGTSRHTAETVAKHLGLGVDEVLGHVANQADVYPERAKAIVRLRGLIDDEIAREMRTYHIDPAYPLTEAQWMMMGLRILIERETLERSGPKGPTKTKS